MKRIDLMIDALCYSREDNVFELTEKEVENLKMINDAGEGQEFVKGDTGWLHMTDGENVRKFLQELGEYMQENYPGVYEPSEYTAANALELIKELRNVIRELRESKYILCIENKGLESLSYLQEELSKKYKNDEIQEDYYISEMLKINDSIMELMDKLDIKNR